MSYFSLEKELLNDIDLIELFVSLSSNFNLGGISYILFILFFSHLRWYAELVEILVWQFLWHFYLESSFFIMYQKQEEA